MNIEWASPYDVANYKLKVRKNRRHYSKKLKHPFNERTGKPLEDSTLKSYNSKLKEVQKEKQRVDDAIKEMKRYGLRYSYCQEEWPGLGLVEHPWRDSEPWTFLGGLVKSKKIAIDGDTICIDDLKKIIEFIMTRNLDEVENVAYLQEAVASAITENFIKLLDQMINKMRGEKPRQNKGTGKRSNSNIIDLNIRRACR